MLDDIMHNVLRMTDMMKQVVLDMRGCDQVDLFVAGPTGFTSLVQDALQVGKISTNTVQDASIVPHVDGKREGSELVAIVGISGRFPGGENLQQFWNTLAQGCDLHEEVRLSMVSPSKFLCGLTVPVLCPDFF